MLASARAFLEGIIDYAGLFPPASLPLDQALGNYLRYRQEPESWMLGRFICPAARLKELAAFGAQISPLGRLEVAVLGRGGNDERELLANLKLDVEDILHLNQDLAVAHGYEARLPATLVDSNSSKASVAGRIADLMSLVSRELEPVKLIPFFECPWSDAGMVEQFAYGLRAANNRRAGWKLRCGGVQPSAFPTPAQVARVLADCCAFYIPWKATAGLHHPLHHFDSGLQVPMHGFVNVLGAGILAHAKKIDGAQLEEIIADEDASHFCVTETDFSWKGHHVTTEAIRAARQSVVTSFGSCSFDEPRDDLRGLHWI